LPCVLSTSVREVNASCRRCRNCLRHMYMYCTVKLLPFERCVTNESSATLFAKTRLNVAEAINALAIKADPGRLEHPTPGDLPPSTNQHFSPPETLSPDSQPFSSCACCLYWSIHLAHAVVCKSDVRSKVRISVTTRIARTIPKLPRSELDRLPIVTCLTCATAVALVPTASRHFISAPTGLHSRASPSAPPRLRWSLHHTFCT
jgi:hypothetical protein